MPTMRIFSSMARVSSKRCRVDPCILFQRLGCTPQGYLGQPDSRGTIDSIQVLRTETPPWEGVVVGNLVVSLVVFIESGIADTVLVPVSQFGEE